MYYRRSRMRGGKVVERTGARGKLRSAYIRDPDGNLVE
jgi:catechol 2,3-dioxygenase-like lactoylglutathione lyase family enzyme